MSTRYPFQIGTAAVMARNIGARGISWSCNHLASVSFCAWKVVWRLQQPIPTSRSSRQRWFLTFSPEGNISWNVFGVSMSW